MSSDDRASGGCLCGGVHYEVRGPRTDVTACHCSQCQKVSGSFVAATRVLTADLVFTKSDTLKWYASSDAAMRGFCSCCGSNLFYRRSDPSVEWTSVMVGTIDGPTGLKLAKHIFTAEKADYYDIADAAVQYPRWPT